MLKNNLKDSPPAEGVLRDVNGSLVTDYSDVAAECDACGAKVVWGKVKTNPTILDDWQDCGDEAYCPACRTQHA